MKKFVGLRAKAYSYVSHVSIKEYLSLKIIKTVSKQVNWIIQ